MNCAKLIVACLAIALASGVGTRAADIFSSRLYYRRGYNPLFSQLQNRGYPGIYNRPGFQRGAVQPTNNVPNPRQSTNTASSSTNATAAPAPGSNIFPKTKPKPRPPLPPPRPKSDAEKAEIDKRLLEFQVRKANDGSPSAQYELGLRYLTGNGLPKDEALGRSWLIKAAQQGNNQAYEKLKNTDFSEEMRDSNGRVTQSTTARKEFMAKSGFPKGRPGYVISHIVPIAKGGSDTPENMEWVSTEDAREKEPWTAASPAPAGKLTESPPSVEKP